MKVAYSLFIDANGHKTYNPTRNDFVLNIHNPAMLSIWRDNVDFQPVISRHVVLKYISKYASKVESYHTILSWLAHATSIERTILQPIR